METAFEEVVGRLSRKSRYDHYNPYTKFDWPDRLDPEDWWMTPDYLTVFGTGLVEDEQVLRALSRRETVNFFSLHVHGIRELMIAVSERIHTPRFEAFGEYLHHFIGEENAHMWFFAEFCKRYGDGIYPDVTTPTRREEFDRVWEDIVVFCRILIFEEIFDYYNARLGREDAIPPILRDLHATHHHDESRHVAFGKYLVKHLFDRAWQSTPDPARRREELEAYVKSYMSFSVRSLYNPHAYRDAGLTNPLEIRRAAMAHPARELVHRRVMTQLDRFFVSCGVFHSPWEGLGDVA